jgi:glycosyltransferase involved in cell wall biosynthesis
MVEPAEISFCATNLNTVRRLEATLRSVAAVAQGIGRSYEVVVAEGPSDDGASELLADWSRRDPTNRVVRHSQRSRGFGRRLAFEASRGSWIVPFDTSVEYPIESADLLRNYLTRRPHRMLFSELCALPRDLVVEVGGWRDLVGGEDIDLYARVIVRSDVVAYPLGSRRPHEDALGSYARQMRYYEGSPAARWRRMFVVQRDQIIGANYRVRDLMTFNRAKPWWIRVPMWGFFSAAYLASRWQPVRPFEGPVNNYLIFREALFRSLARGDFEAIRVDDRVPRLLLTPDEIRYLQVASPAYRELRETIAPYLGTK